MIHRHSALTFMLLVAAPAHAIGTESFRAQGNEPFWSMEKSAAGITFTPMDGEPVLLVPLPIPRMDGDVELYEATVDGENFALGIADTVCVDTMSGMYFPSTVTVTLGAQKLTGCGGTPETLLHGEWIIRSIDGTEPQSKAIPSLSFDAEGRMSGQGPCNRFFGSYTLTGEGLTISNLGASMMMCEPAVMDQEAVVLDILKRARRFEIDADGALVLQTNNGQTIHAIKAEP